jgi:hypothetical protein
MTTTQWADYELLVEFRAPAATNSGVFLRSSAEPKDPASDCYELNIAAAENPFPTGSLVGRQKVNPEDHKTADPDEWHTFKVVAWGGWISAELDGKPMADFSDSSPVRIGHIGLQSNSGPIAFRNVRLRPIELAKLIGDDLENWNTDRGEESRFELDDEDDALRVRGGPGQIETDEEYANFVLQLECRVRGNGLNSGIFFRALRDARWAGYESQIHNAVKGRDATRPTDYGTGGIYRRQAARRVVPKDYEWFTKTIVADGPHIAVWVNGHQVSDWTDDRTPHESAREGQRLEAGVIAIQGHDPGTDLEFREFNVAELPR